MGKRVNASYTLRVRLHFLITILGRIPQMILENLKTALPLLVLATLLSGCMTTSDISATGEDTYSVSTLACPACGGTGKAENMALEAANEFCGAQGKEVVTQNLDIGAWEYNGAGTTELLFKCVAPVPEDQIFACTQKHTIAAINQYGDEATEKVLNKLFSDENGFGFSELANQNYPTDIEKSVILEMGAGYDECEELRLTTATPSDERVLQAAANERMLIMAKLSASQITYGDYAKQSNVIDEKLYSALSEIEKESMRHRKEARTRASENFGRAKNRTIDRSIQSNKSTNCISTVSGNSVYTNCR